MTAAQAADAVEAALAAEQKRKARPRTPAGVEVRLTDVHLGNLMYDASGHWSFRVILRPEDAERITDVPQFFGHRTDLALGADVVWSGRSKRLSPLPKELAAQIELIKMNVAGGILEIQRHGSHRDRRELTIRLAGLILKAVEAAEAEGESEVRGRLEELFDGLRLVEGEAAG